MLCTIHHKCSPTLMCWRVLQWRRIVDQYYMPIYGKLHFWNDIAQQEYDLKHIKLESDMQKNLYIQRTIDI